MPPLSTSLGVHHVRLFARAPVLGQQKVVTLSIWLKLISPRIAKAAGEDGAGGYGETSRYMLPTQTRAVEGFAWADDLDNLTNHKYGLLMTTVDAQTWRPQLRLQVWGSDELLSATWHPALDGPGGKPLGQPWSHLRPFFFSFDLASQPDARCFKVYEDSFPDNKAPFCLPASSGPLCARLAPDRAFTPSRPALWVVLLPFRSWGLAGSAWELYTRRTATRVAHYLSHLRAAGGTGVLLYADAFSSRALRRMPGVQRLLATGSLVLVEWEHIERLQYNSDQPLVYSHALLGASSCGTNLWIQISDMDELLYSPYGRPWPAMYDCLRRSGGSDAPALFRLWRVDIIASGVDAEHEAALWYSDPGSEGDYGDDDPAGDEEARGTIRGGKPYGRHPLEQYDKVSRVPHPQNTGKYIACPARRIVAVWIHTALPLHGSWREGNASCAFFLHMPNYWKARARDDVGVFEPFRLRRVVAAPLRQRPVR